MHINQFTLLKTKRFLPLFITQFLGAFNDNIFRNALVILLTYRVAEELHRNPQLIVALSAGLFMLPFFLFSATAGQLADKYERSHLISIIKFVEILLMSLAALALYSKSLFFLLSVLFLIGTHASFFGPVKYAILPDHLSGNELIAGNGLVEAGTNVAILVGTILGGLFILTKHGLAIVSMLIISIAILGWISSRFIPRLVAASPEVKINWNFLKETVRVIQFSRKFSDIYLAILGISWFWLVGSLFVLDFPIYAKNILNADVQVETLIFTIFSIGVAIGSLLCNRILKGKVNTYTVPLGALGLTLFTIDLFFASHKIIHTSSLTGVMSFLNHFSSWHILGDLLMIAVSSGLYIVPLYAYLQQNSLETHRARMIASNNILNALFMVVAALATMLMLRLGFTVIDVYLTAAILNGFVAIYLCKLLPKGT